MIIYEGHEQLTPITVTPGEIFLNKHGEFHHNDFIGEAIGARIRSRTFSAWVYALGPTPELWSLAVRHRTQILYAPDIAATVSELHLGPGSVVIEAGTGSGSLTSTLARAVSPHGRVVTYEFNAERAKVAQDEFMSNGLGHLITSLHRDVIERGFGVAVRGAADAVFLDLPAVHKSLPHAIQALRPEGRIMVFTPCIEQVAAAADAMREIGFRDVKCIEVLEVPFTCTATELGPCPMPEDVPSTPADAAGPEEGAQATPGTEGSDTPTQVPTRTGKAGEKRGRGAATEEAAAEVQAALERGEAKYKQVTKLRNRRGLPFTLTHVLDEGVHPDDVLGDVYDARDVLVPRTDVLAKGKYGSGRRAREAPPRAQSVQMPATRQVHYMKGHTGYLTCATWPTSAALAEQARLAMATETTAGTAAASAPAAEAAAPAVESGAAAADK